MNDCLPSIKHSTSRPYPVVIYTGRNPVHISNPLLVWAPAHTRTSKQRAYGAHRTKALYKPVLKCIQGRPDFPAVGES